MLHVCFPKKILFVSQNYKTYINDCNIYYIYILKTIKSFKVFKKSCSKYY